MGRGLDIACSRGPTGRFRGRLGAPWTSASDRRRLRLEVDTNEALGDAGATIESEPSRSSLKEDAGEGNPMIAEDGSASLEKHLE